MQFIKPTCDVCCGIAMSMGALILAGGTPGSDLAAQRAHPIHQPTGGSRASPRTSRSTLARPWRCASARRALRGSTGQTIERVHEDMERDRFFTPDDAASYGLIDRVIAER